MNFIFGITRLAAVDSSHFQRLDSRAEPRLTSFEIGVQPIFEVAADA